LPNEAAVSDRAIIGREFQIHTCQRRGIGKNYRRRSAPTLELTNVKDCESKKRFRGFFSSTLETPLIAEWNAL
jgi:hypothetical protein